ncbi:transposase [Amycolatopsis sp.]|uniref:transposase n=1 Tax=Amycolatopsis sp. TaxID=37632 RepID=UPI0039C8885D
MRKGQQRPWIASDGLRARIEPLLPVVSRRRDHAGRRRLDNRKVLRGTLFALYTRIPWEFLRQELGFRHRRRRGGIGTGWLVGGRALPGAGRAGGR